MYINHNQMATNVANTLTNHYGNLQTSTQRLSSGLRVNSAADDAAGLAIRELMRADIAALNQGVRNANDAISLIQTADGALGVIDEKLIRMKELAEQAATGTYTSDQRLMIDSEYQAMASEITRIANATDFNGIHLLNGNLSGPHTNAKDGAGIEGQDGAMKIHFGTMNDSAEDYYYIEIGRAGHPGCGHQVQGQHPRPPWRVAEPSGKHDHQPYNPVRKPAGGRIPHFRCGRGHGNDELCPQPDSHPVRRGHAWPGQQHAADGHAAYWLISQKPVGNSTIYPRGAKAPRGYFRFRALGNEAGNALTRLCLQRRAAPCPA